MTAFDYDLFVIGAGSAGVRASRMAAGLGRRVAVAESRYLGGTCVNVGCVPKKLFVYASEYRQFSHEASGFGVSLDLTNFDWPTLRDRKTAEIERLNGIYRSLLDNSGVKTHWGHGKIIAPNTVQVESEQGTQTYTAEKILLATGGWPALPDISGKEHFVNSNDVFYLKQFPRKVLVVGSGYIAVEFAGIFNGLGAETVIASRSGKLLRGFDDETREFAQQEILKKGIKLVASQPSAITKHNDQYKVTLASGEIIEVDLVFCATGRTPNTQNLGLENTRVEFDSNGFLKTNDHFETSESGVYAMGDLIAGPQLTPVALAEAMTFLRQQYQNDPAPLDYAAIPTAVFSQPNLATVGLTEEQALSQGFDLDVYTSNFKALKHTLSGLDERTFMKLIVDSQTQKVLGAHMVGEHAGEILQGFAVAVKAGLTKSQFDSTIGIHPTSAEEFVTMRTPSRSVTAS